LPLYSRNMYTIDLNGREPPFRPLYNLLVAELEVIRTYLDTSLVKGWICRSTSPARALVFFTPKKDRKLRLCIDYYGLNKITIKNYCPLSLINETLDCLISAAYYIKLDLRDIYYRIRIKKGDEWKTAFYTRYRHFKYLVMPFRLANAPITF